MHGTQEQGFFNGYYDHECYAPLLIFCGRHLLGAKLRASNVDPADGALDELQRIMGRIRKHWTEVAIVVRGDSAYGREDIISDRTSTHEFESNQLQLWFSSFAYVLMQALRQKVLEHTELTDAQLGTIRLKLLKLGAQIRVSVRRIVITC